MKLKTPFLTSLLPLALLISLSVCAFGQGTFRNLDFEHPILPLTPVGFEVPIAKALPGWTGSLGDRVYYNTLSLGAPAISLQGPASSDQPIQGNYSVILQPAFGGGGPLTPIPAIAQTGTVPASAMSIRFYSLESGFTVSFAGQTIPISQLDTTPNYNIYGGDISLFANQTGELRFTGGGYLDNIQFSTQSIPEPGTFGLFAAGVLFLGWRLRGKPHAMDFGTSR